MTARVNSILRISFLASLIVLPICGFAEEKELTVEEFLQSLSTIPAVASKRDPFVRPAPPFASNMMSELNLGAPVLERYPVKNYGVIAVLTGDKYPRALVRLPQSENSKVVIVKERDKLGNQKGVISKISKDGIRVTQSVRSKLGFVEKDDVLLAVGSDGGQEKKPTDKGNPTTAAPPMPGGNRPPGIGQPGMGQPGTGQQQGPGGR